MSKLEEINAFQMQGAMPLLDIGTLDGAFKLLSEARSLTAAIGHGFLAKEGIGELTDDILAAAMDGIGTLIALAAFSVEHEYKGGG